MQYGLMTLPFFKLTTMNIPKRDQNFTKWKLIKNGQIKDDYQNPALSHFGFDLSWKLEEQALKIKKI